MQPKQPKHWDTMRMPANFEIREPRSALEDPADPILPSQQLPS